MKSAPAIAFDYRPSRWVPIAIALLLLLALAAIIASGVPRVVKVLLVGGALVHAAIALARLYRPAIRRCAWYADGQWRVRDAQGNDHAANLIRASVRGTLIVLVLHSPVQRSSALVLLPDNCDADTHRRLRVRLSRGEDSGRAI